MASGSLLSLQRHSTSMTIRWEGPPARSADFGLSRILWNSSSCAKVRILKIGLFRYTYFKLETSKTNKICVVVNYFEHLHKSNLISWLLFKRALYQLIAEKLFKNILSSYFFVFFIYASLNPRNNMDYLICDS